MHTGFADTLPPLDLGARSARAVGRAAVIFGYPLVEMVRLCRLQTSLPSANALAGQTPINALRRWPADASGAHWFVSGWVNLADGPRHLQLPWGPHPAGRQMLLSLYDAWSENFAHLRLSPAQPSHGEVTLVGPHFAAPEAVLHQHVYRSPSDMLWLVGRVQEAGDADSAALASQIELRRAARTPAAGHRPAAVELWQGPPVDMLRAIGTQCQFAPAVAPCFYANLCQALGQISIRPQEFELMQHMRAAGIWPGPFDFDRMDADTREGLLKGLVDAVVLIRSWVLQAQRGLRLPHTGTELFSRSHAWRAVHASQGIATGDFEPFAGSGAPDEVQPYRPTPETQRPAAGQLLH